MIDLKNLPNKQRHEETVLFLRSHWIEVVIIFLYGAMLLAVPVLIFILSQLIEVHILENPIGNAIFSIFLGSYLLIVITIIMTQFTDYYLDTWIVTTERIINIEQKGLFSRVVSELHLNQVQDVTSETHGFLATVLSYGEVYIQTAGTRERFNFKRVDNPEQVKEVIARLVEEDKRRHGDASQGTTDTAASG